LGGQIIEFDLQLLPIHTVTMLICHCHAVNDQTIRRCVDAGARSGHDVREACGAGGGCGGCRPAIDRLIATHDGGQGGVEIRGARG
jgi:bacterioferritin-associated ferredoxin